MDQQFGGVPGTGLDNLEGCVQQCTRLSVVRPAEQGQHQGCPACPLYKSMEARHGQALLGSLCLFLDFLMARKVVEQTTLLFV